MEAPEYDVVAFDLKQGRWRNHLPANREREWSRRLPLAFIPRTYSAITSGSEQTLMRGSTPDPGGAPRPDLNLVFDQVAYHPGLQSLFYFTGGLTAAYSPGRRRWTDLQPLHSPPPVSGGSLAFDPVNKEMVLFGGGHIVERNRDGKLVGHTGTWVFRDEDWHKLDATIEPPPRMDTRMVTDERNGVLVVFGGDGQSRYLADTWLYDLKTRKWRASRSPQGPPARAGHFTVYDPQTGWVIVGGGYNTQDLTDMWAYDAARDRWQKLEAQVPTGFYTTADIAPEQRLIVLVVNSRRPGDRSTCNELFPVRDTYGFRLDQASLATSPATASHEAILKRGADAPGGNVPPPDSLPFNQWTLLGEPAHGAPVRTWGSATFDPKRGEILYWGGGHCGYGGSDVDAYAVGTGRWRAADKAPEFPERAWNKGVRQAGVTFRGAPWSDHGRRIYAHDEVSGKLVMVRDVRLTAGYDPEALRDYPAKRSAAPDAVVPIQSSYVRFATFLHDSATGGWQLAAPAPAGLDSLVATPRGVMAVNLNWRGRLNDAGYQLPWSARQIPTDTAVWLFEAERKRWSRLGGGVNGPQNLYEMTSLAYDTKRQRLLLHGGGARRDELWEFDMRSRSWTRLQPEGTAPPASREAVYLPGSDTLLLCGPAPEDRGGLAVWSYTPARNSWRRETVGFASAPVRGSGGQNRAMVYDEKRDLVLLVLGGNEGKAAVYGLRYQPDEPR